MLKEYKMRKKSTKYEKEERVEEVRKMMLYSTSRDEIISCAKDKWQVSERTVDYYIAEAREFNGQILRESQAEALAFAIEHRKLSRSEAHERKDYRLEFKIAKDEAKLMGLYNIDKPPKSTRKKKPDPFI